MKERYINGKLSNIKTEREELETEKDSMNAVTILGCSGLLAFGVISIFVIPNFGLASLIGAGVCLLGNYKNRKLTDSVIKRLNNEENHLEKISEETPAKKTELNKKRVNKIKSLKQLENNIEDDYKHASVFNGISLLITTAGIIGTFINPPLALVGVAGLGLDFIASKKMIDYKTKKENITNRINNIVNDLEVIKNEDRDLDDTRISEKRRVNNEKSNTKQNDKNEQLVEDYFKDLEIKNEEIKENQKVKK